MGPVVHSKAGERRQSVCCARNTPYPSHAPDCGLEQIVKDPQRRRERVADARLTTARQCIAFGPYELLAQRLNPRRNPCNKLHNQ